MWCHVCFGLVRRLCSVCSCCSDCCRPLCSGQSSVVIRCDCCSRELVGSLSACPGCGLVCRDCCECADPSPVLVADYLGRDLSDSG